MKIDRMNKGNWGKVRAFFDVQTEEGFTMKGFKLVEGINGLFVGFPSQKGNDDEYRDTIWADKDLKDELAQIAIQAYGQDIMDTTSQANDSNVMTENANETGMPPLPTEDDVTTQPFSEDDIPF